MIQAEFTPPQLLKVSGLWPEQCSLTSAQAELAAREITSPSKPSSLQTEGKLPAHTLPCLQLAKGWEMSSSSLCLAQEQGWAGAQEEPTLQEQGHSPTCCVPLTFPGLPSSFLCKQPRLTAPLGPDLPGLHVPTSATAGTLAKSSSQAGCSSPSVFVWKSQAVTAISPRGSRSPQQKQNLQDSRRELGGALVTQET